MSHDAFLITTTACSFINLMLLIVSLSSDYWVASVTTHGGLWKGCIGSTCAKYTLVPDHYEATRAFMLMGMLAGAVASGGLCTLFFRAHLGPISLKKLSTITSLIAGCFVLIAMASFTGVYASDMGIVKFGWSFAIGWASSALFLITGCLSLKVRSAEQR